MLQNSFSPRRLIKSFGYAFKGIWQVVRHENNMHIHVFATVAVVAMACYLPLSTTEWLFVTLAITLVWSAELFNTAIEILTDLVSPDFNEKAGKVKDIAAGGVLIVAMGTAIIGLVIFLPKVWTLLF